MTGVQTCALPISLGAAFLTKPFELARMRALVRALVAAPTARASDLVEAAGG